MASLGKVWEVRCCNGVTNKSGYHAVSSGNGGVLVCENALW